MRIRAAGARAPLARRSATAVPRPPPPPPRSPACLSRLGRIFAEEGAGGYFKGLGPSLGRAAVINGCGIASYDQTKVIVRRFFGAGDGLGPQAVGALVSGFVSATVSTPFDVIKTRMMNQPRDAPLYSGPIDCVVKTARAEGLGGLYKGFVPAYARLAPHRMVHFLALEQLMKLAGVAQM